MKAAMTIASDGWFSGSSFSLISSLAAAMVMADKGGVSVDGDDDGAGDEVLEDVAAGGASELLSETSTAAEKFELLTMRMIGLVIAGM